MIEEIKQSIRSISDFPKKGILFRDLTTIWKEPGYFKFIVDHFFEKYKNENITKIVCIESRGFITGSALAYKLNAGFVPIRKPGKLPADTSSIEYNLEYGTNRIEIHNDALDKKDNVLVHDDLLATGGTISASLKLIKKLNVQDIKLCFITELDHLKGREKLDENYDIYSMIHF